MKNKPIVITNFFSRLAKKDNNGNAGGPKDSEDDQDDDNKNEHPIEDKSKGFGRPDYQPNVDNPENRGLF